jgi:endonuclease G
MAPLLKILAASALLFSLSGTGLRQGIEQKVKVIKREHWQITYSEDFRQPLRVEYEVMCNDNSGGYWSRKGLQFYNEPGVKTSIDADYYNNVWDKGHMAPAADFNCDSLALRQTFSYTNCALQHQDLNRGAWKQLEAYEKELALNNKVTIIIVLKFTKVTRMPSGTAIPTHFQKTIYLNGKLFKLYLFPNQSIAGNPEKFLVKKY